MPKTTSAPTDSSARTSDCAPLSRTGAPAGGPGFGRGSDRPDSGAALSAAPVSGPCVVSDREVALVIVLPRRSFSKVLVGRVGRDQLGCALRFEQKKPSPTETVVRG